MATGVQPCHIKEKDGYQPRRLGITGIDELHLYPEVLDDLLESSQTRCLGIAAEYTEHQLNAIALSTATKCLVIDFTQEEITPERQRLIDQVLCNDQWTLLGFSLDRLALGLHAQWHMRLNAGVDLQSTLESKRKLPRHALGTVIEVLGGEDNVVMTKLAKVFDNDGPSETFFQKLPFRAWTAFRAHEFNELGGKLSSIPKVDTTNMPAELLDLLFKFSHDANRKDDLKPTKVKNDIEEDALYVESGYLDVNSTHYRNRIRVGSEQRVVVNVVDIRNQRRLLTGITEHSEGKSARINMRAATLKDGDKVRIMSAMTIGKDDPTSAETQRTLVILKALQGDKETVNAPMFKRLWHPRIQIQPQICAVSGAIGNHNLNPSQQEALKTMLSETDSLHLPLIIGPPGSGKTSVIARFVQMSVDLGRTVWVTAQSNVAVKNIADRLARDGFWDWRLLVSKDFHNDWHEDLYTNYRQKVVTTDNFPINKSELTRCLGGARVILCTLSMLSNKALKEAGFVSRVPVESLVVDEASQIDMGDFLPIIKLYSFRLKRVCFIGDDKQLAPFGSDDIEDLQSVFELKHLRDRALLLDTQYRLPVAIGNFLSENVYGGLLRSVHELHGKNVCKFVNVETGKEQRGGTSTQNLEEAKIAILVAVNLFRSRQKFKIITPYDAQRSLIEEALKSLRMPSTDIVFNVDSFQGNEEDYIILSLVRTEKLGFLANPRRSNVMLSRCRKGMVICTNKDFIESVARETLVGRLAEEWKDQKWYTSDEIKERSFVLF